jgi:FixJ family two-component response regulator
MPTIAIVEDDPSMLQGLNRLLSARGYIVESFNSAESFLAAAVNSKATCLLLDIQLGGISGLELKRRLTSSGSNVPVIFMTGVNNEAVRQEAVDVGCVTLLKKPFLAKLLIDAIEAVV